MKDIAKYKGLIFAVVVILIISLSSFSIKGCVNTRKATNETIERMKDQNKVNEVDKLQQSVKENEKYKYPKIDKDIKDIEKANETVKTELSKIKDTKKEDIENEVKDYNPIDIVESFRKLGYSPVIISR